MSYFEPGQEPAPWPPEPVDPVLPPPFGNATNFGGVLVLYIMMVLGLMVIGGVAQFFLGFVANAMVTEFVVVLFPICFLLRKRGPRHALRLDRRPPAEPLAWALLGVLSLAILLTEFTHWSDLVFPMPETFKALYLDAVTADSLPELGLLIVAAAMVPGLCEEAAFRGFFQRVGVHRLGIHKGVALAGAMFALMHLDPWHLVALFIIGVYLGYVFAWTDNLWVSASAHAANNAASVILLYLAPEASLSQISEPPPRWLLPIAACGLWFAVRHLRRYSAARISAAWSQANRGPSSTPPN